MPKIAAWSINELVKLLKSIDLKSPGPKETYEAANASIDDLPVFSMLIMD